MKLVGAIIAILFAGLMAFQNCQQAPHPDDLSNENDSQSSTNKIDLKSHKISEVSIIFNENETVPRNSGSYQIQVNKTLKISLPSGQISMISDLDNKVEQYCLTETLTNEVIGILKTSQVCKKPDPPAGQICTMVVKLPYAEITSEKQVFSLGGASDGCGSNSFDLCDDQAIVFQGFVAFVKTNYKSFSCPQ